ncbi:ribosomal protein L4 [Wolfiporia cocos MD-104 SS10]|uniref:Large ribosomal subunit protein uL4m n=1 Tax=Wolfiporia cocos (strain MD-104) TaxID=742152 RepID=A0A2H3IUP5_WOLCO|nr:ribosomal protein L4 [Wolfiporia cocos MD-104 SS10]
MLSAIRRALGQATLLGSRRLSTAVTIEPQLLNASLAHDVAPTPSGAPSSTQETSLVVPRESPIIVSRASPFAQPIYLNMSSLKPSSEEELDKVVELDPYIFAHPIRRDILHLCVVHYLDSTRQGTASTKTRGEVRGSGRKIRPQKGTGKARLGDGQSPMLRGGGVAFGPKPRDFSTKLNRKVLQMGMCVALSARAKENALGVVEDLDWPSMKTKELAHRIEELGWKKTLFVSGHEKLPEGFRRAGDNIEYLKASTVQDLKVYDVVKWPRVVLDLAAVEWFERTLGKPVVAPHVYRF